MKKFLKKHLSKIFFVLFFISFTVAANNIYYKHRIRDSIKVQFSNTLNGISLVILTINSSTERQQYTRDTIKDCLRDLKLVLDITYFAEDNGLFHDNRKNLDEISKYLEQIFCNNDKKIEFTEKEKRTLADYLSQIATYPSDVSTSVKVIKKLESILKIINLQAEDIKIENENIYDTTRRKLS